MLDISRLKKATGFLNITDALRAKLKTKAVLPIPGRAATIIKSLFCHPAVTRSNSVNPLGTPVTPDSRLEAISIPFTAFETNPDMDSYFLLMLESVISKRFCSALSKRANTSEVSSNALRMVSLEIRINSR